MARVADPERDAVIIVGGVVGNRLHTLGWRVKRAVYIGAPLHGARLLRNLRDALPAAVWDYQYARRRKPYDFLMSKGRESA